MARKDFDEYYTKAFKQLKSLDENLKRANQEALDGMCSFDFVERIKKTKAPIEENFKTLTWIKYLLDKPVKKEKRKQFDKVEPYKSLDKKYSQEEILKRNEQILKDMNKPNK